MSDPILVDPEYPSRAFALKPFRRPLHGSGSHQIVGIPVAITVLIEGKNFHAFMEIYVPTVLSQAGLFVGEAQEVSKKAVEITLHPNGLSFIHNWGARARRW